MKFFYKILMLLILLPEALFAQSDYKHWFALPYATPRHGGVTKASLRFAIPDYQDTIRTCSGDDIIIKDTIFIVMPSNNELDTIFIAAPPKSFATVTLDAYINIINKARHSTIDSLALYIESKNKIAFTVYYELTQQLNPDFFALKGDNALGKEFYVPFQTYWKNQNTSSWMSNSPGPEPAYSAINIVAAEDNTDIWITPTKATYDGHGAGVQYKITLKKGQTYRVVPAGCAGWDPNDLVNYGNPQRPCTKPSERLAGTHVIANKAIAITVHDDSDIKGSAWDMVGDQLVPIKNIDNTPIIGYNYVVMRGQLNDLSSGERVLFIPTADNTEIKINGAVVYAAAAKGVQVDYQIMSGTSAISVECSKPTYVFHLSGFGHEVGGAIIPSIDGCTGSLDVSFVRSISEPFFLNLMCRTAAKDSFYLKTPGGTQWINSNKFEQLSGTDYWVLKDSEKGSFDPLIATNTLTKVYNTKYVFHLGIVNGKTTGSGCRYGYFSDFKELETDAITLQSETSILIGCGQECVELKASGGTAYAWSPTEYLDDSKIATPLAYPPQGEITTFNVNISHPCYGGQNEAVTIFLPESPYAFFTISEKYACAPFTVTLGNLSEKATQYTWDFGDGTPFYNTGSKATFTHTYYNTTNSPITRVITLSARNADGCSKTYRDTIVVYPQVNASFTQDGTVDCHPFPVQFTNTSTGNTSTYLWDFGDGGSSNDQNPAHTFVNITNPDDTVFTVRLIANSPYLCKDTAYSSVTVHPYIRTVFTLDTNSGCADFNAIIKNLSVGVDTFYLSWGDSTLGVPNDTVMTSFSQVSKYYQNNDTVPLFYRISLKGVNEEGCWDTLSRKIDIYSKVVADFNMSDNSGCDSVFVNFSNLSTGYKLKYYWEFGDAGSSSTQNPDHWYVNKDSIGDTSIVRLVVQSKYYCYDTAFDTVVVYPYINADFGVDTVIGCPPLGITIHNQSFGVQTYNWTFGDGSPASNNNQALIKHTYNNTSYTNDTTYTLKLVVSNSNCSDSLSRSITVYPDIIAEFDPDTTTLCDTAFFSFNAAATQGAGFFLWNFGDGATSTQMNSAQHAYERNNTSNPINYTVSLFVTASNNKCVDFIDTIVTVYPYVDAVFSVEDYIGCHPFPVTFRNNSQGATNAYNWYIDNNLVSTLLDTTAFNYTFPNLGDTTASYIIRVYAQNAQGCNDEYTDTVSVYPYIESIFGPDILASCDPATFLFTSNSKGASSFKWNFGDTTSSVQADSVYHTYEKNMTSNPKNYKVSLKVTASNNTCTDEMDTTVTVYPFNRAVFAVEDYIDCAPFTNTMKNGSHGTSNTYSWYVNNVLQSVKADTSRFTYTYNNMTNDILQYAIKLVAVNAQGCKDSIIDTMAVYPQVIANYTANPGFKGCHPFTIGFSDLSKSANTWKWSFGDKSSSVNQNPTHTFKNFKNDRDTTFPVKLRVEADNCYDDTTINVTVYAIPKANFSLNKSTDCHPFTATMTNSSEIDPDSVMFYWNYTEGSADIVTTKINVSHQFTNYTNALKEDEITLIAESEGGCRDTLTSQVYTVPVVIADFNYDSTGCTPVENIFQNTSTNATNYQWDFGDNQTSSLTDPDHQFINLTDEDTVFNVKLTAYSYYDVDCKDDITKVVTVYPRPFASFTVSPISQIYDSSTFILIKNRTEPNASSDKWAYTWDYGSPANDGDVSEGDTTFNVYYSEWSMEEDYNVTIKLISRNKDNPECYDTAVRHISVRPPLPEVVISQIDSSGCEPLVVKFEVGFSAYVNNITWDFGDGTSSNEASPTHVYDSAGYYNVELKVEGDGGITFDYKGIRVYRKPVVDFDIEPKIVQLPNAKIRCFPNVKYGDFYLWRVWEPDYKEGSDVAPTYTADEFSPWVVFSDSGYYNVKLIVTSENNCMDSILKESLVNVVAPGYVDYPTAFVPDANGPSQGQYSSNEISSKVFRPIWKGIKEDEYLLQIFNRWGELLFESTNIYVGWDGYYDGKLCKQDVYVWRVKGRFIDERPFEKVGTVTLLQ